MIFERLIIAVLGEDFGCDAGEPMLRVFCIRIFTRAKILGLFGTSAQEFGVEPGASDSAIECVLVAILPPNGNS